MLTDDDLTRELGAAFRAGTGDLTYRGRRRPRRTAVVAVPAVAVGLAVGTVAVVATLNPTQDRPQASPPGASGPVSPTPTTVTENISLAGYTFAVEHQSGTPAPVYATLDKDGVVPDGFKPVSTPGTDAKAWIGEDPSTGESTLYVQAPTRSGGQLFSLHSKEWSQDELVDLFRNGSPRTVPMIKE